MNQARKYFGAPLSTFETSFLTSKPTKDFIYDYDGPKGGRTTDADAIYGMMKEGKIQTSSEKFMDYFSGMSRGSNKVARWNLSTYRSASLYDFVGGSSGKGEWGPIRFGGLEPPKADEAGMVFNDPEAAANAPQQTVFDNPEKRDKRWKAFANYVAATNLELNMKDDEDEIDELNKEMAALNTMKGRKKDFDDRLNMLSNIRLKHAKAGRLFQPQNVIRGFDANRNADYAKNTLTGRIIYAPAPNPPTEG